MFPDIRFLIVVFLTSVVLSPLAFGMVAAYLVTREPLSRPPGGTFLQTAMHMGPGGPGERANDAPAFPPVAMRMPSEEPAAAQTAAVQPPHALPPNTNDHSPARADDSAAKPSPRETSADESASTDHAAPAVAAATLNEPERPIAAAASDVPDDQSAPAAPAAPANADQQVAALVPAAPAPEEAATPAEASAPFPDVTASIASPSPASDTRDSNDPGERVAPPPERASEPAAPEVTVAAKQAEAPEPESAPAAMPAPPAEEIVASDQPLITGVVPMPRPRGFVNAKARARKAIRRPRPQPTPPQPTNPFTLFLNSGPS